MWIDEIELTLESGSGGDGAVSFHREKFVDLGGPDGGNGGKGGDIIVEASRHHRSLSSLRGRRTIRAGNGSAGHINNRTGKAGADARIVLPLGTVIRDASSGRVLVDLSTDGESRVLLPGGRGGRGNAAFRSSTNQAPNYREIGESGRRVEVKIELKLIADVGLVGLPNAGKSTLLSRLSAARPKIADYPFTTLEPLLGVVDIDDGHFVLADLPGIIAGAHQGKGLGLKFLRHIERTRIVLHVIDATAENLMADYETIRDELHAYGHGLDEKPTIVVFNKVDAAPGFDPPIAGATAISAVSGVGLIELKRAVAKKLASLPPVGIFPTEYVHETEESPVTVRKRGDHYVIEGDAVMRYLERRAPEDFAGWSRFWHLLERWGVSEELKKLGVAEGDTVVIGDREFEYRESN